MEEESSEIKLWYLQHEIEDLNRKLVAKKIQLDAELVMEAWYAKIDSIDTDGRVDY